MEVVPDRTHVGIRLDIGCTGRGVGSLEEVSARVRETLIRHCMCHTASVYVGCIVVKKIWDTQSSSSTDRHLPGRSSGVAGHVSVVCSEIFASQCNRDVDAMVGEDSLCTHGQKMIFLRL